MPVPNYGENEQKYEIEEFEQPLLLFPIQQVEYLSDIYQVPPLQVPDHVEDVFSKVTKLTHSSISEHQHMTTARNHQLVHATWQQLYAIYFCT